MTLGARIKECRQNAKLSQEKVAELVGVSRQAVTKWEAGQSAPSTENLFKLAEIFGTTVDLLTTSSGAEEKTKIETMDYLYKNVYLYESPSKQADLEYQNKFVRNVCTALLVVAGYAVVYLIGRLIWCYSPLHSMMGWLFHAKPSGEHSYLFGWLLSSDLYGLAMFISVIPALFGKVRFSISSLVGFLLGFLLGILFGPNPAGAFYGNTHYGWAIWGGTFIFSMVMGGILEKLSKKGSNNDLKNFLVWCAIFLVGTAVIVLLVRLSIPQYTGN